MKNAPTDIEILTARDPAVLDKWAAHGAWQVRAHAAANHSTSAETLSRLALDPCAAVRRAVAHHPHSTPTILVRLAADLDPEVREEAFGHPATPAETLLAAAHGEIELDPPPLSVVARWVRTTRQPVPMELAVRCLEADDIEIRRIGIAALPRLAG